MKKTISLLLLAFLLFSLLPGAYAEAAEPFALEERAVLQGMSRSWLQGYEPAISRDKLSLILPVSCDPTVSGVQAELIPAEEAVSPFKPQDMSLRGQRVENGLWALRFSLQLHPDRTNGDYPCVIRITGSDGEGNTLTTDIPYTLRIRDGWPNPETAQLELSDLTAELSVGEEGVITAVLKNPCRSLGFENLTLQLSDTSGDILPLKSDVLRLPDLLPGEETEIKFPVTVLPGAAVTPHSLLFSLRWTALGAEKTQAENITVPVKQDIRLEQGGLRMAESVVAGDSITATLPLMNMGRADVVNAMVTVSLPGLTERQSVLVGTIAPGETKQAQITLSAGKNAAGSYEGTLLVECTDNDGNPASFSLPLHLAVEEPAKTEAFAEQPALLQKRPTAVYVLSAACAVLTALLIIQSIFLRKRIYRLEEERL